MLNEKKPADDILFSGCASVEDLCFPRNGFQEDVLILLLL